MGNLVTIQTSLENPTTDDVHIAERLGSDVPYGSWPRPTYHLLSNGSMKIRASKFTDHSHDSLRHRSVLVYFEGTGENGDLTRIGVVLAPEEFLCYRKMVFKKDHDGKLVVEAIKATNDFRRIKLFGWLWNERETPILIETVKLCETIPHPKTKV